ncbi:MAG: DUF3857 domain-containing protein [Bacteroidales bacterium]|nr:DUF3857 domain-containing protein [Bacteroidales bacterium]
MRINLKFQLTIYLLVFVIPLRSQDKKLDYGKVSDSEVTMTYYEQDMNAPAVILGDNGNGYFIYTEDYGFQIMYTRHLRVKIINDDGFVYGKLRIPLYSPRGTQLEYLSERKDLSVQMNDRKLSFVEEIIEFKGSTYNIESGKIVKSKVSINDLNTEEGDQDFKYAIISMPDIKPGSVFEVQYTIRSDYIFYPRIWQFQYDIPVVEGHYVFEAPEIYHYKFRTINNGILQTNQIREWKDYTFSVSSTFVAALYGGRVSGNIYTFRLDINKYEFNVQNVPAYKSEKLSGSPINYKTKVEFELESYEPKYFGLREYYSQSWNDVIKELNEDERFGKLLKNENFIKEDIDAINNQSVTDLEKMVLAYKLIQNRIVWNKHMSFLCANSLKKAYNDKSGNIAEINLLLVLLLRNLNIPTDPVILSTRDNGIVNSDRVYYTQFNYLIARAKVGEQYYLLDASEPTNPYNIIPERCLNGKGLVIGELSSDWIDIRTNQISKFTAMASIKLEDNEKITGTIQTSRDNYLAAQVRNEINQSSDPNIFEKELKRTYPNMNIENYSIENLKEIEEPLKEKMDMLYHVENIDTVISVSPILYFPIDDFLFIAETRQHPIDFIFPRQYKYLLQFTIPDEYNIIKCPEPISLALPDDYGKFTYQVKQKGNSLQIVCNFSIDKVLFSPDNYEIIRDYSERIRQKLSENIALRKK